jgi:fatty-acyl-CoA synthase
MPQRTLIELLRQRSESTQADALAIRFWERGLWIEWSWREYWAAAQCAACAFREAGVRRGDHVLILVSAVRPAVATLFGLWTLGAVPIQIGEPSQLANRAAFLDKLADAAKRMDARFLLVSPPDVPLAPHDLTGDTLLHAAVVRGSLEDVEVLLASGALVDAVGDLGNTALHHAASRGHVDTSPRKAPEMTNTVVVDWAWPS